MGAAFDFFIDIFSEAIQMIDDVKLEIWNFNVSLMDIFVAIIITGLVITVFWKGART